MRSLILQSGISIVDRSESGTRFFSVHTETKQYLATVSYLNDRRSGLLTKEETEYLLSLPNGTPIEIVVRVFEEGEQ